MMIDQHLIRHAYLSFFQSQQHVSNSTAINPHAHCAVEMMHMVCIWSRIECIVPVKNNLQARLRRKVSLQSIGVSNQSETVRVANVGSDEAYKTLRKPSWQALYLNRKKRYYVLVQMFRFSGCWEIVYKRFCECRSIHPFWGWPAGGKNVCSSAPFRTIKQ
jgi:hypothetical protein